MIPVFIDIEFCFSPTHLPAPALFNNSRPCNFCASEVEAGSALLP